MLKTISQNDNSTVVCEYDPPKNRDGGYQSEAKLEEEFIALLQKQGYERAKITNAKELKENLRIQIEKLNNFSFTSLEWEGFYKDVIANSRDGAKAKAKKIQEDHIHTLKLDSGTTKNIMLIDKANIHNNHLQVINQYTSEGRRANRYDVSVLVNGLPLVHIELKKRNVDIKEAFNQIKRYERESFFAEDGLFEYVQIFVISNGGITKYFSNTTREAKLSSKNSKDTFAFTSFWADARNKTILDLMDFGKTFFAKHSLLNVLSKYCVFTSDENLLVLRPYQIVACERILEKIKITHQDKSYGSEANGGYIWHTTGSGKTLTSFKTATLAQNLDFIEKVLFVVDRKDLDYQTMKEYDRFQKDSANSNANTEILRRQLSNKNAKIIITTIQKLDKFIKANAGHSVLDSEVVLIFDECHRSQLGSMHASISKAFKKYHLFGFTGTPIFAENCDKNIPKSTTEDRFGKALHKYTIIDAIADKNVLPFRVAYHNTIKPKDKIKDEEVGAIDTKSALLDDRRIDQIARYTLEHFAHNTKNNESYSFKSLDNVEKIAKDKKAKEVRSSTTLRGFNSIFACDGIEAVKKYYQAFKNLDHNLVIATIYSYSPNEDLDGLDEENNDDVNGLDGSSRDFLERAIDDYNARFSTTYDTSSQGFQNYYKDVSLRMKNKQIDILIVANMFLTGFDATTLNTLWVDKNLKYHGLLQAFSRTNRILNDVKTFGNIVCFRDLEDDLNKALTLFGNKDSKGVVLLRSYEDYYFGYSQDDREYEGYQTLITNLQNTYPLGERIISEGEQKKFIKLFGRILKMRNILTCFDKFKEDDELRARDLQDYQGMYLDLYREMRSEEKAKKEDISDDVVFEIELIKQVEVNIDYILSLIAKYAKTTNIEHKGAIKKDIESSLNSSLELRNKKDLIMDFIDRVNIQSDDISRDFADYVAIKRQEEFDNLIKEHKLNKNEAYKFVKNAFESGKMDFKGTEFPKLLPKENMSFFGNSNRSTIKDKVAFLLKAFFDKFVTISSSAFDEIASQ